MQNTIEQADLRLRIPSSAHAWLRHRAASNGRSVNSEMNMILKIVMNAEPGRVRLREQHGLFIVDGGKNTEIEIFLERKDALKFALKRLQEIGLTPDDLEEITETNN